MMRVLKVSAGLGIACWCVWAQSSSMLMTNRDARSTAISAGGDPVLISFTADPSSSGDLFDVRLSANGAIVSLLTPAGTEVTAGNADSLGYTYAVTDDPPKNPFFSISVTPGFHTQIQLPASAVPGAYQVKVTPAQLAGTALITATYFSSSAVRAGVEVGAGTYQVGDTIAVTGAVFDGTSPITNAKVKVTVGNREDPSFPPAQFELADSGPLDDTVGDGVYTGLWTTGSPGRFTAAMRVTGLSTSGIPFSRLASAEFRVLEPTARIESLYDAAVDDDGDGLPDRIAVTAAVNVTKAGNYQLLVNLAAGNGSQATARPSAKLAQGRTLFDASFAFADLNALGADGPYAIKYVALLFLDDDEAPVVNETVDAGMTQPYPTAALVAIRSKSLGVTPASLAFGDVAVNGSRELSLTVRNAAAYAFTESVVRSNNPVFSLVSPAVPFTTAPGGVQTVIIRFSPTVSGVQSGSLTLSGLTVPLSGSGVASSTGSPQITPGGVVNAADYAAKVSRGALTFAFGINLASQPGQAQSLPLQLALGGASVTVAGIPAPVFVVNPTFIEFQIPYEVPLGTSVPVVVTNNGVPSNTVNVTVADYAVGVFQYNRTSTIVDPDIFHTNGSLLTPTSPAVPGETLVAIANGIGKLNNPPRTGAAVSGPPYPTAADLPAITIGGVPAVTQYAGLLASLIGVVQINIQLPANLPSGSLPLVIQSPGDSSPPVNVYVAGNLASAPKLSLSSNTLAFGNIAVGQTKDLSLAVSNTGSAALTVNTMQVSGVGFSLVSPSTPFTVQPGGSQTVTVRCAPASAALLAGTVTISSNDPNSPASISLSGTGVAAATPAIGVNPTSLNFGTVTVGQTKDMTVALSNTGSGQLTVSALAASTGFLVTAPVAPVNIASGGSSNVTVRFVPTTATAMTGTLIITSNDPKNSALIVSLSGTGATAGGQTKTVVLQVDGGTFNRVSGFGSTGQAGAAFVNRLTPSSYPATLQNVQIFFGNRANGLPINAPITVLYGANSSGTATISGNLSLLPTQVLSLGTFSTYPVTPLTITSGDFIVGFRVDNAVGIYPADTDSTSPSQMRSYYAAGDFAFTLLDSVPGLAGNLAIRATATVPQ